MDEIEEPPWDDFAEQTLLGQSIAFPDKCRDALLSLAPDDWYRPAHADLAAVLVGMFRSGQEVDVVTVYGQCAAQGVRGWDAASIFGLTQKVWRPESASEVADRIRELSGRRQLLSSLSVATSRLKQGGADEVRAVTGHLRDACDRAEVSARDRPKTEPQAMQDFLAQQDERHWLVPGLLERMDRTVITGAEGGGKSVLCSQMAACLAGGIHPFGGTVMGDGTHGVRVLVLDCENSPAQSRRRYRWVIERVNQVREQHGYPPVDWNEQMRIDMRPAGIDLLSGKDVSWLEHSVAACAPDLLVLGPLYKLHHRDPSDEPSAREVAYVIDSLRERYGFALLTEAHAGKAKNDAGQRLMAPIGSSLWLRWPEFGFGLRRAKDDPGKPRAELVDVVAWRGAREERAWPEKLQMGHTLPWIPDPDYLATMDDYH